MIERNIYFIKKDGITELGPDQITIDEVDEILEESFAKLGADIKRIT